MPKYLLLKHYRGGPEPHRPVPPMDQWAPEDVEAHMAFLKHVGKLLEENGEYVDAQALTPARTWVRYGGPDAAPVTTDGPLPETSDLGAGWYMIDVESQERAVQIAAYAPWWSNHPGDRRRLLCARGRDGAAGQPGQARPAGAPPGPTRRPRRRAACALPHLYGRGDLAAAPGAYTAAARRATDVAERDHLVRQAARARAADLRPGHVRGGDAEVARALVNQERRPRPQM